MRAWRLATVLSVLTLLVLSAGPAAGHEPGAGAEPENVRPGRLNLPLTVTDHAGYYWRSGPVTGGVPLPPGLVTDLERLRIVDADGNELPAQFAVMERWWDRPDRSVRWLLVDFQTDVFERETTTVYLRDAGGPRTARGEVSLVVEQTDEAITVVTGPLKFTVNRRAFNFIDAAWLDQNGDGRFTDDEIYIKPSLDNGSVITAGEWTEQSIAAGTKFYSSATPPRQVVVEESGPLRVTILADGMHGRRGAQGEPQPFYDYRVRITAYAGKPYLRVGYAICNNQTREEQYVWPMTEAALVTRMHFGGAEHVAVFLSDNQPFSNPPHHWPGQGQNFAAETKASMLGARCSDARVVLYQDSSGGEEWKDLRPNGHARRIFGGDTVPGVTFRGWKVLRGGEETFSGYRSPGLVDLCTTTVGDKKLAADGALTQPRGLIAVMTDFWQNYPKAIECERDMLAYKVFPSESGRTYDLVPGTRKTHELLFYFHGPRLFERHYDWVWRRATRPLLARAPAEWVCRIPGAWDLGLANVACVPGSQFDRNVLDGSRVGWENFGWISPWNPGGQHWNEATQFAPWVLRGDYRGFEQAAISSRWAADLVPVHYQTDDMDRYWMLIRNWNRRESKVPLLSPPGWKDRRAWIGTPDSGHMGMVMWLEHYRLTGDRFARDAVLTMGNWGRAFAWGSNHDSKPPFRISWCRKRDPDAEPDYMNFNRYQAWPLFDFLQGYSVNGDPTWLAEARTIALGYRNAMRANPVGYICDTVNPVNSTAVYGGNYVPALRARSASKVYANFQLALVVNALAKYYGEHPDEEVRDAILGSVDILVNRSLLRDGDGRPVGWTYCWGDLWGPNVPADVLSGKARVRGEWNSDVVMAVGYGHRFSGRADFLEPLKVAYEQTKWAYDPFANAGFCEVIYPRRDTQPPDPVKDLSARIEGGKAVLTWTAPAGSPVDYQVKYSTARIVERVEDWTAESAGLPQSKEDYERAVAAALKRQVSFYMALNAKGEPSPGQAGDPERFELTLPPGTYHFALKSLDAAHNQSAMSNVATATVE